MKIFKERNPLLARILVVILFVLLGCIAPKEILFLALCIKQDLNIPPGNEVLVSACKRPYARSVPVANLYSFMRDVLGKYISWIREQN